MSKITSGKHKQIVDAVLLSNTIFVDVSGGTFCDRSLASLWDKTLPLSLLIFHYFLISLKCEV